jgi:uncharacterized membrane protein YbhN (UPF0104 family)
MTAGVLPARRPAGERPSPLQRLLGRRPPTWLLGSVATLVVAVAAVAVAATVDGDTLTRAWRAATRDPAGIALVTAALLTAFTLRACAWRRVLPELSVGQGLAAIHLAMGANHVLPFRLGEPLRVASIVRRTHIGAAPATASTVVLRLADIVTLVAVGAVAAPAAFSRVLGPWGWLASALVALGAVPAWLWVRRVAQADPTVRLPGPTALALTTGAWLLEAVAVWQALRWAGIDVSPRGALLVTAAAVSAQVAAIAPSGFGTYEAAAVAALVSLGHDPGVALAAALTTHACKTAYSLVAGGVALVVPRPGFVRLGARRGPALLEPAP